VTALLRTSLLLLLFRIAQLCLLKASVCAFFLVSFDYEQPKKEGERKEKGGKSLMAV